MDHPAETRVALTPALHELLRHLVDGGLPAPALAAAPLAQLQAALDGRSSAHTPGDGKDAGVGYDLVRKVGWWAQGDEGRAALREAELDPSLYHPHALLSLTTTLLPPSVTRPPAAPSNPDQASASPFLPPSAQAPARAERSFGQDWADVGKQLGAVANVVFSAGGVAGGVYWLGGHGHRWTQTKSLLLSLFAFFAVVAVEVALYWIHFSKLERARADDARAQARWLRGGRTKGVEMVELPLLSAAEGAGEGESEEAEGQVIPQKDDRRVSLRKRAVGAPLRAVDGS